MSVAEKDARVAMVVVRLETVKEGGKVRKARYQKASMHFFAKVRRCCVFACLVLTMTLPVWADTTVDTMMGTGASAYTPFTPLDTDLSIAFLRTVFGNVGNVLDSASGQLLGTILGILNLGLVAFAGGFILHNVIRSSFGSAQALEGSEGTGWSITRIVGGVTLLVPQFSGYSLMQVLVMWVALKGVYLADSIWTKALDYANSMGGGIYQVTTPSDYGYVLSYVGINHDPSATRPGSTSYMNDYLASAACLEAARENESAMNHASTTIGDDSLPPSTSVYAVHWGEDCQMSCTDTAYCSNNYATNVFCFGSIEKPTLCGGYAWGRSDATANMTAAQSSTIETALRSVMLSAQSSGATLFANAFEAVENDPSTAASVLTESCQSTSDATSCQRAEDLVSAATMYFAGIKPLLVNDDVDADSWNDSTNWYATSSGHGWITAGMYYFNLIGDDTTTLQTLKPVNYYDVKMRVASSLTNLDTDKQTAYTDALASMLTFSDRAQDIIQGYLSASLLDTEVIDDAVGAIDASGATDTSDGGDNNSSYTLDTFDGTDGTATNYSLIESVINALLVRSIDNMAYGTTFSVNYDSTPYALQYSSMNYGSLEPTADGGFPNLFLMQFNIHSMLIAVISKFLGLNILKSVTLDSASGGLFCADATCSQDPADYNPFQTSSDGCNFLSFDDDGNIVSDGIYTASCSASALSTGACWQAFKENPDCLAIGEGVVGQLYATSQGYRVDPLRNMVKLGIGMIEIASNYWLQTTIGLKNLNETIMWDYFGTTLALGFAQTVVNGLLQGSGDLSNLSTSLTTSAVSGVTNGITSLLGMFYQWDVQRLVFFEPVGSALASLIFVTGVILAYYIPSVPLVLFIFAVVGWLILLLEAVIAAPLLALSMTHPAGHDLLGRSEQSLILLLGLFLRPAAILLGMITAAIFSYNIITWTNYGFAMIMNQYLGFVGAISVTDTIGIKLIGTLGVYFFYAYMMIDIINYIFSLIYQVPDRITRWIGGQPEYSSAQQMAGEIQAGLQGAAQGMAQGGGQTAGRSATSDKGMMVKGGNARSKDKDDDSKAGNT